MPPRLIDPAPSRWSEEETTDDYYADKRNFYKVEEWTRDDQRIERLIYAGNNIAKARTIFREAHTKRPRGRYTIRQRARVLDKWPK